MELRDKTAVITGGSGGIGKAMAKAFIEEGARGIVLADLNKEALNAAALELNCESMVCNVTDENQVAGLARYATEKFGQIDLFCSNAGAGGEGVLTDATNEVWQNQWELHVMSHVYAARAVLPQSMMTEWYWSGSLYAFARVCNLRCAKDTQLETQEVANKIDKICNKEFPHSWKYLRNLDEEVIIK